MKLKKTEKGQQSKHETLSRQGRTSKVKGANFERLIAKKFQDRYGVELKRTPQSGGFAKKSDRADDYRGDITIVDTKRRLLLHIECKAHKTLAMPKWLKQAENDCPEGRTPVVINHEHGTSNDYITLSYLDFMGMIKKSHNTVLVEKPKKEEWLPIPDFEGYFISNCGRVKSTLSHNGKGKSGNPLNLFFVFKNQQKWSLPKWLKQAQEDCPEGAIPIVVFHEHGTSNDYVTLRLEDFLNLAPKDKVIGKRVFK